MERPLALHESALSEPEYQAYTCILHEIAPETAGAEWEAAQVPMGEAKGWIRGKYAVDAALLDQILRLFPATAFQASTIKGPQLLAILRLISHAQAGLGVDRSLVFTQATKPLGFEIQAANVIPLASPLPPPPSRSSPYPKPPPPVRQGSSHTAPPDGASSSGGRRISSEDAASRTSLSSNPFRRSLSQTPGGIGGSGSSYARSHSAAGADDESSDGGRRSPTYSAPAITRASRPPSVTRSSARKGATPDESPFPSNNPFFRPPDSTAVTLPVTLPPLPPRKPPSQATAPPPPPASHVPIQPPPRHPAPPPPPKLARKPSHTHSTSTSNLIRQSLIAAKTTPKAPEGTLASAMKSLVIVKSSSSNHPSSGSGSGGTLKDRVRGEKEKSSESSATTTTAFSQSGRSAVTSSSNTPSSSSSMEYVAAARVQPPKPPIRSTTTIATTAATAPHSRSVSPSKLSPTKLSMAEAQDIVQISASSSTASISNSSSTDLTSTNRPTRSKSLHGTASSGSMKGPVPTPPPRRRPESVQVTGSPFVNAPTSAPSATTAGSSPFNLSRRSSVQHPPPRPAHSPSPSRSTSTSVRSPTGATTPPSFNQDPFSTFYSTVKQHLAPKPAAESVNANIFQPAAAELHKIGTKLEGGLAPGRGYLSHRGKEGERLVKKGQQDEDDDDDGYRRLSAYSDAPTVDSDTPGMDTNPPEPSPTGTRLQNTEPWMNWDPTPGPRPIASRGGSEATITSRSKPASPTYSTASARSTQQRRDVQMELDQLRAQSREGWGRIP